MARKTVFYDYPPDQAQARERRGWLGWLYGPAVAPPPPPSVAAALGKPVVARQPSKEDAVRQRRALDRLADVLNALAVRGSLVQLGPHDWRMKPERFEQAGTPNANHDRDWGAWPGDTWVDTAGAAAYVCISNSVGLAVWKKTTP